MARRAIPPDLFAVRAAVRRALPAEGLVLVGCSGGADSLALAGALAHEAPGRAGLVSIDHGLAPGSAERAAAVASCGRGLGLAPALAVSVEVIAAGSGPEAAARDARLDALRGAARRTGAVAVLLAHTRDDQAEQVLLGLARGSGARSLAGMPASRDVFRRPLLDLTRAVVRGACRDLGLEPWEDPANTDPAFARSRVRHRVLPVLEAELGPGIAGALARSASWLAEDAAALDSIARETLGRVDRPGGLDAVALGRAPAAVRKRVLAQAAGRAGVTGLTSAHLVALDGLVTRWHGQGPVSLPGGAVGQRRSGRLVVGAPDAQPDAS